MAAGCSFSVGETPEGVAEKLIEEKLATQLGVGEITATCEAPANRDAGTTFTCTSPTELGEISWLATMTDSDSVNVVSTNVVRADALRTFETAAVSVLKEQFGLPSSKAEIDCGERPVVLGADKAMVCALTDPADPGVAYDATITITDLATGDFRVKVTETPR